MIVQPTRRGSEASPVARLEPVRATWRQRFIAAMRSRGEARAGDLNAGVHGARGLFASSVLVFHVWNSGLPVWHVPGVLAGLLNSLQFGVELFFAISGFVIAGTMTRSRTPTRFIVNRATRIYPVLWVNVLAVVAVSLVVGREPTAGLSPAHLAGLTLANLAALPGIVRIQALNPAAWTLSYEMTFYLLCFTYLWSLKRLGWRPIVPVVAFGIALIIVYPRALFFPCGVIVAAGWMNCPVFNVLAREPLVWLGVFLFAWSQIPLTDDSHALIFRPMLSWLGDWRPLYATVAFMSATLTLHGIAQGYGVLTRLLRTRFLLWLGTISFSLYLWHPLILGLVKPILIKSGLVARAGDGSQLLFLCAVIVPVLITAALSQLVLEQHATERLRKALFGLLDLRQKRAIQPATALEPRPPLQ